MGLALRLSERSTCARAKVGCVIVSQSNDRILAIGYNGNAERLPNKCDSDLPGGCGCIHAEDNCCTKLNFSDPCKKTLYTTVSPCVMCAKRIINAHIDLVVYRDVYRDQSGLQTLEKGSVPWRQFR